MALSLKMLAPSEKIDTFWYIIIPGPREFAPRILLLPSSWEMSGGVLNKKGSIVSTDSWKTSTYILMDRKLNMRNAMIAVAQSKHDSMYK